MPDEHNYKRKSTQFLLNANLQLSTIHYLLKNPATLPLPQLNDSELIIIIRHQQMILNTRDGVFFMVINIQ